MADRKFFLGQNLLGDIRRTVHRVDAIPVAKADDGPNRNFLSVNREPQLFRVGTVSAAWSKGSAATVFWNPGIGVTVTMTATNLFADVGGDSGPYNCAVGRVGNGWYLLAAECPENQNPQTVSSSSFSVFLS